VLNNPLMYTDTTGEFFGEALLVFTIVKAIFAVSAVFGAYALFENFKGGDSSMGQVSSVPSPSNNHSNTNMASSISQQSKGGGGRKLDWASVGGYDFEYSTPVASLQYRSSGGPYGISLIGNADPLQGIASPTGFMPNDGLDNSSHGITSEDVMDTVLDFVPIAGGLKDIYKGIRDGNGWQIGLGSGGIEFI